MKKYTITVSIALAMTACGESSVENAPDEPYVHITNAEYVLNVIEREKSTGAVLHMKPETEAFCEHLVLEISVQNSEGKWEASHMLYPGKDSRETFGQKKLEDQLQFIKINSRMTYGITALGCQSYGGDTVGGRGLFATFEGKYNKLNYIGEIGLVSVSSGFSIPKIENRAEFAEKQLSLSLPELHEYFYENIMQPIKLKLSPEKEKALKEFQARVDEQNDILGEYNILVKRYNHILSELSSWRGVHVGLSDSEISKEAKTEFDQLLDMRRKLNDQLIEFKKLIDQKKSKEYIVKYMLLFSNYQSKQGKLFDYLNKNPSMPTYNEPINPYRSRLMSEYSEAENALHEFKKANK